VDAQSDDYGRVKVCYRVVWRSSRLRLTFVFIIGAFGICAFGSAAFASEVTAIALRAFVALQPLIPLTYFLGFLANIFTQRRASIKS
jgi:hypothetical protein